VVESQKDCIALVFVEIDSEESGWPWWQLGRIMVERDPTLCGLLNGNVGNLCGWPNFGNKFCLHVLLVIYFPLHIVVLRVLEF
jgi:hypothetical protein